mgnify:CR=1 FL=1
MTHSTRYETHWEFLKNSAKLGKLSHAYLFSGNDLASQKQLAVLFSQFLNCESQLNKPCKQCMSCKIIEAKSHPDLLWIEGVREIPISAIRDLQNHLSLSTWQSSFKIAVIEQAHLMNQEAQSSLLKCLEEPKKNTVFLLLTSHPDLLFDTIRSRTQELRWYVFPSAFRGSITPREQELFDQLKTALLSERFEYAKKAGESAEDTTQILEGWLKAQRAILLRSVSDSSKDVAQKERVVKTMQEMLHVVHTTNVTPRLALEQVLLELY